MTSVTFTWKTDGQPRRYVFQKGGGPAHSSSNVPVAIFELEPGVYDMLWSIVGAPGPALILEATANEQTILSINDGITDNGTGGGPTRFEVPA